MRLAEVGAGGDAVVDDGGEVRHEQRQGRRVVRETRVHVERAGAQMFRAADDGLCELVGLERRGVEDDVRAPTQAVRVREELRQVFARKRPAEPRGHAFRVQPRMLGEQGIKLFRRDFSAGYFFS